MFSVKTVRLAAIAGGIGRYGGKDVRVAPAARSEG